MHLIGYVRRSRDNGSGVSEAQQEAEIRRYCEAYGHRLTLLPPDLDESGSKLNRPSMQKALDMLTGKKADGLIAAKLDRLSRNVSDFDALLKRATDEGWSIIVLDLAGVDLASDNGQMIAGVVSVIAQWDWNRKRSYLEASRRDAVLIHGVHGGNVPPIGYEFSVRRHDKAGNEQRGPLMPTAAAGRVTAAFQARAQGAEWGDVIETLGVKGIGAAQSIIKNRAYLGEARSGEFVKPDAHPALIDEATFQRANRQRSRRSVAYKKRKGALLGGGILRCSTCGYALTYNGADRGDHYRCMRHKCKAKASIQAKAIEPYVFLQALAWHATTNPMHIADLDEASLPVYEEELAKAQAEQAEVERLHDAGELLPVAYGKALTAAQHAVASAEAMVAEAEASRGWLGMSTDAVQRRLLGEGNACKDVEAGRDFIHQMLRIVVRPVGSGRKVPVEKRIKIEILTPAAALHDDARLQIEAGATA